MHTRIGFIALLMSLLLPQMLAAQMESLYYNESPGSDQQPRLLLDGINLNVLTGITDIQYANYSLLPPEPTVSTSVNLYVPVVRLMPQMALAAEVGLFGAMSLRLENQYHVAVPIMAHIHYGAGAYGDARKWVGIGAGFGLEPHWTLQSGEQVGQETAMTGFLEFTIYQNERVGIALRYQSSIMSAYFYKRQLAANFLWHLPF